MDSPMPIGPGSAMREWIHRLRREPARLATLALAVIALGIIGYFAAQPRPSLSSPPGAAGPNANAERTTTTRSGARANTDSRSTGVGPSLGPSLGQVVVHVAGAVVRPGVVSLPAGSRVVDAIDAAGGVVILADPHQLDLAAVLIDGTRIYVPLIGERVSPANPGAGVTGVTAEGVPTPGGVGIATVVVNLNTATQAELETLPGVGPSLARAILAERERLAGFSTVADLKRVRGIGDRRFEQLEPLVTV